MDVYISLITSDEKVLDALEGCERYNPDFFPKNDLLIKGLKKKDRRTIRFLKYSWETLTYVRNLRIKYPQSVRVGYIFFPIVDFDEYIPDTCIKGSNWLTAKNYRRLSDVPKYLGMSIGKLNEEVEKEKSEMIKQAFVSKTKRALRKETRAESRKYEFQKIPLIDENENGERKV